ncbi:hypothetical protein ACP70R_029866 [Stipagrostis hirtigluma subsp. patula]
MAADLETLLQLCFCKKAPRRTPSDSKWEEVKYINHYAVFIGYMSIAVRALAYLVVGWATVVLLGGFVSVLEKKDFWCLTAITFAQAAGIFDPSRNKRISNIWALFSGIWAAILGAIPGADDHIDSLWHKVYLAAGALWVFKALTLTVIMSPIVALYMSGPHVPIWLAVWRLRHRDYGNQNGDPSSPHLMVALDILYTLVVFQGVIVYYMTLNAWGGKRLVHAVVNRCGFKEWASPCVWDYLAETRAGCAEDPSFTVGRNFVTYAVDLIKSESADRRLSGLRILDTLIGKLQTPSWDSRSFYRWQNLVGRRLQLKQLVIESASSDDIILKMLQMLDSRGPYDKEMRKRAARIVAHLAGDIHLKRYPLGIHWVASLLDTFEQYSVLEPYQHDWLLHTFEQDWCQEAPLADKKEDDNTKPEDGYKDLVLQGLRILAKLATNKDNCIIINNTKGLLSKIMAPVTMDLVHSHGDEWSSIVEGSLRVMCQLVSAPGKIGKKLRREISSNKKAITVMERILDCQQCAGQLHAEESKTAQEEPNNNRCIPWRTKISSGGPRSAPPCLHEKALETLTEIYIYKYPSMDTASRKKFMKALLDIFLKSPKRLADSGKFWDELESLGKRRLHRLSTKIGEGAIERYLLPVFKSEKQKVDVNCSKEEEKANVNCSKEEKVDVNCSKKEEKVDVNCSKRKEKVDVRETAARALIRLSFQVKDSATIILEENDNIVNDLADVLLSAEEKTYRRVAAAVVLEHMCVHYTKDEYLNNLKEALTAIVPMVLQQIHSYDPAEVIQKGTGTNQVASRVTHSDIENQCDESKDGGNQDRKSRSKELGVFLSACEHQDTNNFMRRFIPASLSLCVAVLETFISPNKNSAGLFNAIILRMLKDMVERNMNMVKWDKDVIGVNSLNQAYCLKIVKLISKMVISMMKHKGSYNKEDLDGLMDSLSIASRRMSFLDASMVFASNEDGAWTVWDSMLNRGEDKPIRSLKSLVEEAQGLVNKKKEEQALEIE